RPSCLHRVSCRPNCRAIGGSALESRMARKLKSDRILFLTTILLVGLSIVMVYSASAVVALERYHQPYLFLTKQVMWAMLGVTVLGLVMRIDYHNYRQPAFIWSGLIIVTACLAIVL